MRALYREQLDAKGCATPDCGHDHSHLTIHSRCHPESPTWAEYCKASGAFTFTCAECNKPIVQVQVAAKTNMDELPEKFFRERGIN